MRENFSKKNGSRPISVCVRFWYALHGSHVADQYLKYSGVRFPDGFRLNTAQCGIREDASLFISVRLKGSKNNRIVNLT